MARITAAIADRYRIERELGAGGMATVYLAHDIKHDREVAIKVLRADLAETLGRDRFLSEIRVAARLNHPHILPLHESGEAEGYLFYVMPVMSGQTVRRVMATGPLSVEDAVRITSEAADALDYAHRHDVVHRDIKPENILLHEGHAIIADFGIGKAIAAATDAATLTQTGVVIGTPAYMSPEQALGDPALDGRSDLYSLGIVLFEMLTGALPHQGSSVMAALAHRLQSVAPTLRSMRDDLPLEMEQVVACVLSRDPVARYATGATFAGALREASAADAARRGGSTPVLPATTVSSPGALIDRSSVVVLPFTSLSADPDNAFFADGIAEDVIATLSKVRALKVISRTTAMSFRAHTQPISEIAAQLRVATVLEGSVRRVGNRVRVVAQLVDGASESSLWAETYDRELTDVFAIQSDVALAIAKALRAELSTDERDRVRRKQTHDVEAYQLYVRGRQSIMQFSTRGIKAGIDYLERAIRKDPQYAQAHALLAYVYREVAGAQGDIAMPAEEAVVRAKDSISKAMSIDPDLGVAHCMNAYILATCDYDFVGAERGFLRALALDPGDADTYDLYGQFLQAQSRFDEALTALQRAEELDPLAHRTDVANLLVRAGRYDEAIEKIAPIVEFDPTYQRAHGTMAWAYILSGRHVEGIASLERAVALSPGDTMYLAQLGAAFGRTGDLARAKEIQAQLQTMAQERYVSPYHLAYVLVGVGDQEQAMDMLEQAYTQRSGAIYGVKGSYLFTPLRAHPRFQSLLRKMNLN